jgi:hypothetical protein
MFQRIVIRHRGSAAPRVDEIPVESFVEMIFGRDETCQVIYDPLRDETVSRRHAKLLLLNREPVEAGIADLGSRNGTFVNGRRIEGQVRLAPGDWIQLGAGGPEFQFDLDPPAQPAAPPPPPAPHDLVTRPVMQPAVIPPPVYVQAPAPPAPAPQFAPPPPSAPPQFAPPPYQQQQYAPPPQLAPPPQRASSGSRKPLLFLGLALALLGLGAIGYSQFAKGNGNLLVKVFHQRTLISGAYKAYGNPDAAGGKYWFGKVILENTGKGSVRDIKVSYQIPDFISWTTPDEAPELLPGQTAVFIYYPKFPAKVTGIRTRTPSTLETKIEYDDGTGKHSRIEKREFEFFGLTEFAYTSVPETEIATRADLSDNDELLAAYVHDEDPVVKTFYAKISEVSGGINTMQKRDSLIQMARSTYNYLVATGMTYSGAKGVPDRTGEVSSTVQSIRVPRDVIYGNSGLCIELALMWCSIGQAAGAKSYLVLVPGHAFTILQSDDGFQLPIETTAIGGGAGGNLGRAATFEESVESAAKRFKQYQNTPVLEVLDIRDLQARGIRPPELADVDRAELTKLLDDRRAGRRTQVQVVNTSTGRSQKGSSGIRSWTDPNGRIAVAYPADWNIDTQDIAAVRNLLPGYMFSASDPTKSATMDVTFFNASSVQQVFQQYSAALSRLKLTARTGNSSQLKIGGRDVLATPITITSGNTQFSGALYVAPVRGGGFAMVGVSARQPGAEQWTALLSAISASIRFGN